jgi:hypothetical protein
MDKTLDDFAQSCTEHWTKIDFSQEKQGVKRRKIFFQPNLKKQRKDSERKHDLEDIVQ